MDLPAEAVKPSRLRYQLSPRLSLPSLASQGWPGPKVQLKVLPVPPPHPQGPAVSPIPSQSLGGPAPPQEAPALQARAVVPASPDGILVWQSDARHRAWCVGLPPGAAGEGLGCIQLPKSPGVPWRPLPGRHALASRVPGAAPHQPLVLRDPVPRPNPLWGLHLSENLNFITHDPPVPGAQATTCLG